jgi:transposase
MARSNLKLELPGETEAAITLRHAKERNAWRKHRLLAVKLAMQGTLTAAQVSELCGIARGRLFEWVKTVRRRGLEALFERGRPGPRPGSRRNLDPAVNRELQEKLDAGDFVTAVQARRWLEEKHGVRRGYQTVWHWLKKSGWSASGAPAQPLPERPGRRGGVSRGPGRQAGGAEA